MFIVECFCFIFVSMFSIKHIPCILFIHVNIFCNQTKYHCVMYVKYIYIPYDVSAFKIHLWLHWTIHIFSYINKGFLKFIVFLVNVQANKIIYFVVFLFLCRTKVTFGKLTYYSTIKNFNLFGLLDLKRIWIGIR